MNALQGPILHIVTRLEAGGVPLSVLPLLEGLRDRGLHVELATGVTEPPARDMLDEARALGIPVHVIPTLRRDPHPIDDLCALFALWRLIRSLRPRIVHVHTSKAGFIGRLAARLAGRNLRIYSPHGTILEGYFEGMQSRFFTGMERLAARWTDAIIGLTREESESYIGAGIGRPEQHVQIPVSIPVAAFHPPESEERQARRSAEGIGKDTVLLVWAGRLVPVKNLELLLHALALIPADAGPWHCWVFGDGPQEEELRERAVSLGIADRVRFWGYRPDLPVLLGLGDCFLLTSRNEGFGRVLLEAMAARLPVVATRVGGVPSVLEEGRAGLLVPSEDPAALAAEVGRLIRDPAARADLVAAGTARIREGGFEAEQTVSSHVALYEEVDRRRPIHYS